MYHRTRGDHYIMTKPGVARPVVIPMKKDLKENIVLSVARTMGITKQQIEEFLDAKGKCDPTKGSSTRTASS